jgi:hypothetical protein
MFGLKALARAGFAGTSMEMPMPLPYKARRAGHVIEARTCHERPRKLLVQLRVYRGAACAVLKGAWSPKEEER